MNALTFNLARYVSPPAGSLQVVIGQSLALGYGVSPSELPASYTPSPLVQILVGDHFQMMQPGVNTGTPNNPSAWGPEVGIAMAWEERHPGEPLYLVKVAIGSTFLAAQADALDWSPESHGELFDRVVGEVATAKGLTGLDVSTTYWVQGQQDATDATAADAYGQNLSQFMDAGQAAWGTPQMHFVVAEVSDGSGFPYATAVRMGQAAAVAEHAGAVEVSDVGLTYQPDDIHLTGAGELTLGERMEGAADPGRLVSTSTFHLGFPNFGSGFVPEGWVFQVAAVVAGAAWAAEFIQRSFA